MVFSSETFLFLFLPVFLVCYYLTPVRWRSLTILAGSYLFYGWWRFDFLGLLILTTLWSYAFGLMIKRNIDTPKAKIAMLIGVFGNLCVLGVFKYLNFFIDSFAALVGTDAAGLGVHWHLILPIGVSFYVFQSISYLMDVYRKDTNATVSFFDFAAFIALFPQLIAGPILRFKDLADQFEDRTHSPQMFADGMARFTIGLGKKVIIADSVAPIADLMFANPDPSAPLAWLGAIAYMIQLYFDFSGYSDMAVGLGMMMGFRFIENFDTPYISRSITEFWRRWHISLSVWLRDYLYIPLGGNRKGVARTYLNLWLVMVLGGLWHGANWTFVCWGIWHGTWLAVERYTGMDRRAGPFALVRTLLVVLIGWVAFRAVDMGQAVNVYAGMLGLHGFDVPFEVAMQVTSESLVWLCLAIALAAFEPRLNRLAGQLYFPGARTELHARDLSAPTSMAVLSTSTSVVPAVVLSLILILSVAKLAEQSFSPFLYFQF